jgi:predicted dehydrogenase
MYSKSRRKFLTDASMGIAAATLLSQSRSFAASASERVRVGVIGCGPQGNSHVGSLMTLKDAQVVYICDVDPARVANGVQTSGGVAKAVTDFRKILDDPTIDAVSIATPDHWHAPVALLAMEAGKHVYVEKPCCHNIREGQLLREAVKKTGKVFAHGTQARANLAMQQAIALLRDGVIGDVMQAKCWNWQLRENIGHKQPSIPPEGIDYDMWVGPAEWMPYQENRFHYHWHWWYNFGCGDLGNDGIHEFDYALWGLGVDSNPSIVSAAGGKYFFDDDQEFPDTQQVTFEFNTNGKVGDRRMFIYEQKLWSTTYPFNVDSGAEYYGTKGKMFLSKRGKFEVRGSDNKVKDIKLSAAPRTEVVENHQNWLECIKSGGTPNANVDAAVRTAIAVHLANIATRLQRTLRFDVAAEQVIGDEQANSMLSRTYRKGGHWGVPVNA